MFLEGSYHRIRVHAVGIIAFILVVGRCLVVLRTGAIESGIMRAVIGRIQDEWKRNSSVSDSDSDYLLLEWRMGRRGVILLL